MKKFRIITGLLFILATTMIFASATGWNPLWFLAPLVLLSLVPKPKGVLMFNFADLLWGDGKENMGGLKTIGWYAPISSIDNFPPLPALPASPDDEVTLEASPGFTFLAGAHFFRIYSTMETSFITDEPQGDQDGQSFVNKAEIFFPGTEAEVLAFAKAVNNTGMVFIFEEVSGRKRVIGNPGFPAKCKPKITTGQKTADRKGMTMEIFSYAYTPAPLYGGPILDGTSGSVSGSGV